MHWFECLVKGVPLVSFQTERESEVLTDDGSSFLHSGPITEKNLDA